MSQSDDDSDVWSYRPERSVSDPLAVYRWLLSLPLPPLPGPYHWQIEADRERLVQEQE